MRPLPTTLGLIGLWLLACGGGSSNDTVATDTGLPDLTGDGGATDGGATDGGGDGGADGGGDGGEDGGEDTGEPDYSIGPCYDDGWGMISNPEMSIHVREDGDDSADGSHATPVASLSAAYSLSHLNGAHRTIAVGPGVFSTRLVLREPNDDGVPDHGLAIEGCDPWDTVLTAADPGESVLLLSAVTDVRITGLTLDGGTRSLHVWNNSTAVVTSVEIQNPTEAGLIADGRGTFLTASEVSIFAPIPQVNGAGNEVGYGIAVGDGATLEFSGGGVFDAVGAGIMVNQSTVILTDTEISGTTPDSLGAWGRGVHAQVESVVVLEDVTLSNNADAGLFSLRNWTTALTRVNVQATTSALIPDTTSSSGDGIVVTKGNTHVSPDTFSATLSDVGIEGSARAAVLLSGVTASSSGTVTSSSGYGTEGILMQEDAVLSGEPGTQLDTSLDLNHTEMATLEL